VDVATLVLLRHGESAWNAENRFTGWVDVELTRRGQDQARHSGRLLRERDLLPDAVHTSLLRRALHTSVLAIEAAGTPQIPVRCDWRLNERCYGALQGQDRRSVRAQYGAEQFRLWRRSYEAAPPPVEPGSAWDVSQDPRYRAAGVEVPRTESLADVVARLLPYWNEAIVPDLRTHRTVLVVAHSNSLRALAAHVDGLSAEEVLTLDIPTGMPLRYELDDQMLPTRRGGEYLEPAAAAEAARAVAALGDEQAEGATTP
jgi:2,3-bisphosphoglycerate-dependent phosphoglycerate mutase